MTLLNMQNRLLSGSLCMPRCAQSFVFYLLWYPDILISISANQLERFDGFELWQFGGLPQTVNPWRLLSPKANHRISHINNRIQADCGEEAVAIIAEVEAIEDIHIMGLHIRVNQMT